MRHRFQYNPNIHGDWNNEDYYHCPMQFAPTDKDTPYRTFMHYSESEAQGDPITVFGHAKEGLFYNYSDRLYGTEWNEGWELAKKAGLKMGTARFMESVLNHFHDSTDVNLQHILLGVNRSNGYHYLVYGYTYTSKSNQ